MHAAQLTTRLALLAVCWCATSAWGLRLPGVQLPSRAVVYKPLDVEQALLSDHEDALVLIIAAKPRRQVPARHKYLPTVQSLRTARPCKHCLGCCDRGMLINPSCLACHCRPDPQQPLLSFSPEAGSQVPHAVQQLIVQGMQQLKQLGMRGGFGLHLDVLLNVPQSSSGVITWHLILKQAIALRLLALSCCLRRHS